MTITSQVDLPVRMSVRIFVRMLSVCLFVHIKAEILETIKAKMLGLGMEILEIPASIHIFEDFV